MMRNSFDALCAAVLGLSVVAASSAGCNNDGEQIKKTPDAAAGGEGNSDADPEGGRLDGAAQADANAGTQRDTMAPAVGPPRWIAAGTSDPRLRHTATLLLDGRILLAGGQFEDEGSIATVNTATVFDPSDNSYTPTPPMPAYRMQHSATLLADGRVVVAGGFSNVTQERNQNGAVYDPTDNTWSDLIPMNAIRTGHATVRLPNGNVWLLGGYTQSSSPQLTIERFNPATNLFENVDGTRMALGRGQHAAMLLDDGRILVVGGYSGVPVRATDTGEIYDPNAGGDFVALDSTLALSRGAPVIAKMMDGRVMVTGGSSSDTDLVDLFDPTAPNGGAFAPTEVVPLARRFHQLTVLQSGPLAGQVLWSGGRAQGRGVMDCHLYNPATGMWTATAMHAVQRRDLHTATALPDGRVFVFGGLFNGDGVPTGELFEQRAGQ